MGIIFGIVTLLFAFYVFLFASQGMRLPGSKYLIYLFPGDLAPLCFRNCISGTDISYSFTPVQACTGDYLDLQITQAGAHLPELDALLPLTLPA